MCDHHNNRDMVMLEQPVVSCEELFESEEERAWLRGARLSGHLVWQLTGLPVRY